MACVAKALTPDAAGPCRRKIASLANYDARWPSGGPDFVIGKWLDDDRTRVALAGTGVEFQNHLGNWARHRYSCMYNTSTKSAEYATVEQGR